MDIINAIGESKGFFVFSIITLITGLVCFALSYDRYVCAEARRKKEKEERDKEKIEKRTATIQGLVDALNNLGIEPEVNPNATIRTHVFAPFSPDSDVLACKHCGKADVDLADPCVPLVNDNECEMRYLTHYQLSKQNFFCMSHQWYSDTAKGCKSPFRVK